ncbi:hypothetical protein [Sphingobium sp. AP50]|uniref:hypothetical protein n=1 Tax=Sphingobium sp. AP50 TaxID=1884369 RepID=UPI001C435625|nr:hypothetical protein [Sphingobium sp. AP50]
MRVIGQSKASFWTTIALPLTLGTASAFYGIGQLSTNVERMEGKSRAIATHLQS